MREGNALVSMQRTIRCSTVTWVGTFACRCNVQYAVARMPVTRADKQKGDFHNLLNAWEGRYRLADFPRYLSLSSMDLVIAKRSKDQLLIEQDISG